MSNDAPAENEFVKLTFEGEFGSQSPIKGRVTEVDTNPTDIPETSMVFIVNDESGGRNVMYSEGNSDGEAWSNVVVVNRNVKLGDNADWKILQ